MKTYIIYIGEACRSDNTIHEVQGDVAMIGGDGMLMIKDAEGEIVAEYNMRKVVGYRVKG